MEADSAPQQTVVAAGGVDGAILGDVLSLGGSSKSLIFGRLLMFKWSGLS